MYAEKRTYVKQDNLHIPKAQRIAIHHVFSLIDASRIAFVGGIADYLNLREYYDMPINDLDFIYEDENDLKPIIEKDTVKKFKCNFYTRDSDEVLISDIYIDGSRVHIDYFKRNFLSVKLTRSLLLGKMVRHASFTEMKKFHNDHIEPLTSRKTGGKYDWKRLYKHSRKASLYNNIQYLKERGLLHTLKRPFME